MTHATDEPIFSIGTASRLTGIPADTLRAWERRYNAITPRRCPDNNRRGYTRSDLARLGLIKQLVDQGHAVSSVVYLGEEALKERMRVHAGLQAGAAEPAPAPAARARVLVFGEGLPFLVEGWTEALPSLEIVGAHTLYSDFERAALTQRPEVLLIEQPALQPDAAERIRDLAQRAGVRRVVVVYAFAASALLETLEQRGVVALRAPVTALDLDRACRLAPCLETDDRGALEEAVPPRRYDGEALAAIASAPTRLRCECPKHLTELLFRLGAFEAYSAECESRNAEDMALHAHLNRAAGQARALLEDALAHLLKVHGVEAGEAAERG